MKKQKFKSLGKLLCQFTLYKIFLVKNNTKCGIYITKLHLNIQNLNTFSVKNFWDADVVNYYFRNIAP